MEDFVVLLGVIIIHSFDAFTSILYHLPEPPTDDKTVDDKTVDDKGSSSLSLSLCCWCLDEVSLRHLVNRLHSPQSIHHRTNCLGRELSWQRLKLCQVTELVE